jgi:hypothetical protein
LRRVVDTPSEADTVAASKILDVVTVDPAEILDVVILPEHTYRSLLTAAFALLNKGLAALFLGVAVFFFSVGFASKYFPNPLSISSPSSFFSSTLLLLR